MEIPHWNAERVKAFVVARHKLDAQAARPEAHVNLVLMRRQVEALRVFDFDRDDAAVANREAIDTQIAL